MLLSTKLLNLLAIGIVAIYRSEVTAASGEADVDSSLKQALFLVELLKSDFAKILRENNHLKNGVVANSSEENSTCPTTIEDLNITTQSPLSETLPPAWSSTATVRETLGMRSEDPRLSYSSWPPMPMPGFPLPGPNQPRNFPADENFRFPYRFGRRRMIPDYYYYDSPIQRRGAFRRLNGPDPIIEDLANATATTQAQTTTYLPSTTSEVTTLPVEETTKSTSTLSTNITQPSTASQSTALSSTEPNTQPSTQPTSESSTQPTSESSIQPTSESTTQPTTQYSTLPTNQSSTQPTTIQPQLSTRSIRSKFHVRTPVSILKATSAVISKRHKKLKLNSIRDKHLRRRKTTTEKSEDFVMSQVASELIEEFKGTKSENIPDLFNQDKKDSNLNPKKKTSTTMKIYLSGSSRLPVPLPENNAFCFSYPNNPLCGSMK